MSTSLAVTISQAIMNVHDNMTLAISGFGPSRRPSGGRYQITPVIESSGCGTYCRRSTRRCAFTTSPAAPADPKSRPSGGFLDRALVVVDP